MTRHHHIETRYVHPGQIVLAESPMALQAVIGPAVAVCLYDKKREIGGMAHCSFPMAPSRQKATSRFISVAVSMLVRRFLESGSQREDLVAKVFGGSKRAAGAMPVLDTLGRRNVLQVHKSLADEKIPILSEDLGGKTGRRLIFLTNANKIRVLRTQNIRESDWKPEP